MCDKHETSRDSSPDITGDTDDMDRRSLSAPPLSPRVDSESERPLSSTALTQSISQSGSAGSAGSPSPSLR